MLYLGETWDVSTQLVRMMAKASGTYGEEMPSNRPSIPPFMHPQPSFTNVPRFCSAILRCLDVPGPRGGFVFWININIDLPLSFSCSWRSRSICFVVAIERGLDPHPECMIEDGLRYNGLQLSNQPQLRNYASVTEVGLLMRSMHVPPRTYTARTSARPSVGRRTEGKSITMV